MKILKSKDQQQSIIKVSIYDIDINKNQPRKTINEESIVELSQSIKKHGILQPIIVRKNINRYSIVAGERRFRAARKAGIKTIPCVLIKTDVIKEQEIALIENIQREQLNIVETAYAIKQLIEQGGFTHEEIATRLGKSRASITNIVRLLGLNKEVLQYLAENKITEGHAKVLLNTKNSKDQTKLAQDVIKNSLSVRELEKRIKEGAVYKEDNRLNSTNKKENIEIQSIRRLLEETLYTKVRIEGNQNKGRIIINFHNQDDVDRILNHIIKKWMFHVEHKKRG